MAPGSMSRAAGQSKAARCAFASAGRWPRAAVAGQQARLVLFWLAR
jgi:hypothetical protein